MAQFKVLKRYRDLELGKTFEADDEVEMTVKRAEEIRSALKEKGHEGDFLERLDKPETRDTEGKDEDKGE